MTRKIQPKSVVLEGGSGFFLEIVGELSQKINRK